MAARTPHPIEVESYRILRSRIDLSHLPPLSRAVTERVIHAAADVGYAETLRVHEASLRAGRDALLSGAPVVVDTRMAAAGLTTREATAPIADPRAAEHAPRWGTTRSAAAFRIAAREVPDGAVWLIGNAPTALEELLAQAAAGELRPALVIGLPVGFVGAAESKDALAESGLPHVTNRGERGGTAVAVAALNALLHHDEEARP